MWLVTATCGEKVAPNQTQPLHVCLKCALHAFVTCNRGGAIPVIRSMFSRRFIFSAFPCFEH